jgi:hypothetical protein
VKSREEQKAELLAEARKLGKALRALDAQIPVPLKLK